MHFLRVIHGDVGLRRSNTHSLGWSSDLFATGVVARTRTLASALLRRVTERRALAVHRMIELPDDRLAWVGQQLRCYVLVLPASDGFASQLLGNLLRVELATAFAVAAR